MPATLSPMAPPKRPAPFPSRACYVRGCSHPECSEVNNRYHQELRAKLRGTEPKKHGITGAKTYGCQCPVCTEAVQEANRKSEETRLRRRRAERARREAVGE